MDEETTYTVSGSTADPEPGSSGHKSVMKQKKKAAPAKKKADKKAAPAKKLQKETAPVKKANKATAPSKTNQKAEPTRKAKEAILAELPTEKKKTTLELVCEAIAVLGDSRKGLSVPAIKKYVKSKQDSEVPGFNTYVNRALNKGIENGMLVRPPASKDVTGAIGHFRLAKPELLKRRIKEGRKKTDSEHASDSEATEKPVKSRKRNLSDTYIDEMVRASTPKPSVKETEISKDKQTKKVTKKNANDIKDISDSKIVVKKTKRKSTKSYSSDTEVNFKKSKTAKTTKQLKKAVSDKPTDDSVFKVSKPKVKKLFNNNEEKGIKSGKAKTKKQA